MNKTILVGRITKDPELRTSSNGKSFVAFTLAVTNFSGDKEYTSFFPCYAWEKVATNMEKFVSKGQKLLIDGSLSSRQVDNEGKKITSVFVLCQKIEYLEKSKNFGESINSVGAEEIIPNEEANLIDFNDLVEN